MDETDAYERTADGIKRMFLDLVAEKRPGKRKDALDWLSSNGDPEVRKIGEIGLSISKVVTGEAQPGILDESLKNARTLPVTDYWQGFIETGGQVIVLRAMELPPSDDGRKELFRYGFDFINLVIADGFPISKTSVELLKRAKAEEADLAAKADGLIKRNGTFLPLPPPKSVKRPKPEGESKGKRARNAS